jgi:hypothetical protein
VVGFVDPRGLGGGGTATVGLLVGSGDPVKPVEAGEDGDIQCAGAL